MTNKEFADSLRMIADFFEGHDFPVPETHHTFSYYDLDTKEEMARLARALGSCEKELDEKFLRLRHKFGKITFEAIANRFQICERVVVGKKIVPEVVIPERRIPASEVEIIEWHCPDSLLGVSSDESASN